MAAKRLRCALLTVEAGGRLRYEPDALLAVSPAGRLTDVSRCPKKAPEGTRDVRPWIAIPGLIDAHCHLSQYPAVAADGLELLPWLKENIFPLERRFRGEKVRPLARHFFHELARHGTTCAAVYTSIWKDSTHVCFEEAEASGLRVIMGKVMMDRGSYDQRFPARRQAQTRALSLDESEDLCRRWHEAAGGRLLYAFTPRFAVSCSMDLMKGAGKLARDYGAYVQTHLSENQHEVGLVKKLFPKESSYTEVYASAGLLGPRSILAHSIWLSEPEFRRLEQARPCLACCPTSNAFLRSGIMNLGRMMKGDIPAALGSDVAGGPTLDLFEVMRQAVYSQRYGHAHGLFDASQAATPAQAFSLATLGGARALRLEPRIGSLEKGKEADFVLLDPADWRCPGRDRAEDVVSQLVFRASRAAVRETWAGGRPVFQFFPNNPAARGYRDARLKGGLSRPRPIIRR